MRKYFSEYNRVHYIFWLLIAILCVTVAIYCLVLAVNLTRAANFMIPAFYVLAFITFIMGGAVCNFVANHYEMIDRIEGLEYNAKNRTRTQQQKRRTTR
jgi:hypothetical protein